MKNFVNVFTASMAKKLLEYGFTIVDLKQDKQDPDGKRTIFIFRNENGLEDAIKELINERKNK